MRAVLTGSGAVFPRGPSELEPLDGNGQPGPAPEGHPVTGFNLKDYVPTVTSYVDRCSALAMAASKLALEDAGVLEREARERPWGLVYASHWGCLDSMELFFAKVAKNPKFAPPLVFSHSYANSPSSLVCIEFGLNGVGATFSEGATGAITALGWARDRLERTAGREVGGVLVCASDSLSKARRRHGAADGGILGEAGAAVTIETEDAADARGAPAFGVVLGWGSARAEAALERAVRAALEESGAGGALRGAWGPPGTSDFAGVVASDSTGIAGDCGPAASLLALARLRDSEAGRYLIAARDAAGSAAALVVERTP
jgi:3-oxoacyl-(acyl-carrier-protein) synthase